QGNFHARPPRAPLRWHTILAAAFILERDVELRPVGHLAIVERHVELDHLGDTKVAQRLRRCFDRVLRGLLPRCGAGADQFDHGVSTVGHAILPRSSCFGKKMRPRSDYRGHYFSTAMLARRLSRKRSGGALLARPSVPLTDA